MKTNPTFILLNSLKFW